MAAQIIKANIRVLFRYDYNIHNNFSFIIATCTFVHAGENRWIPFLSYFIFFRFSAALTSMLMDFSYCLIQFESSVWIRFCVFINSFVAFSNQTWISPVSLTRKRPTLLSALRGDRFQRASHHHLHETDEAALYEQQRQQGMCASFHRAVSGSASDRRLCGFCCFCARRVNLSCRESRSDGSWRNASEPAGGSSLLSPIVCDRWVGGNHVNRWCSGRDKPPTPWFKSPTRRKNWCFSDFWAENI